MTIQRKARKRILNSLNIPCAHCGCCHHARHVNDQFNGPTVFCSIDEMKEVKHKAWCNGWERIETAPKADVVIRSRRAT